MSLTASEIKIQTKAKFDDTFPDLFVAQLKLYGFTDDEIDTVSDEIDYICAVDEPALDEFFEEQSAKMEKEAKKKTLEMVNQQAILEEKELAEGYSTQDAKQSFTRAEPIFIEPVLTNPTDIQDADYSIVEDQPETYGAVDRVLNWWKINKKRKHAEFVHASGTLLKINEAGDLTVHAIGSAKIVFESDVSESISGNKDFIISGGLYEHIVKDVIKQLDANFNFNVGQETNMTSGADTTIIGANINLNP